MGLAVWVHISGKTSLIHVMTNSVLKIGGIDMTIKILGRANLEYA